MNYTTERKNLWSPLADFGREMDSLLSDFTSTTSKIRRGAENVCKPLCDVAEEDGHYMLSIEMPGVAKENIKIEIVGDILTVLGERHSENHKKKYDSLYGERRYGNFRRSFELPGGTDADKIEANYQDGILRLVVPKAESAKPRQIKIGSNTTGFFGRFLAESRKKEEVITSDTRERVA